ncbi:hypothetical protein H310_06480 [Aphanomyces invadans]|uniref:Glutamine cyclotransferase n=1 Tax=Aphanomyces invadans TaxID=157072 RepID=A0A024U6R6_9STRA|nr:hypothetical protein H310_06480 [Aphanomyces invadans]ETW01944.1 hypothetical protein H310_06480 [Aphanomyces invadans]|eukprot:XP_008869792.1 hypothetical protein H310_06480 [Aphanomyces invadans]
MFSRTVLVAVCLFLLTVHGLLSFEDVDAFEVDPTSVTHGQYTLVAIHPHDPDAFTEGLLFHDGILYESTGLDGKSFVREHSTNQFGVHVKEFRFPADVFGEGIAILDDKIYALTYKSKVGFVLDRKTFALLDTFHFETTTGEGWGMTTDGHSLIVSDGSAAILFLDPSDMHVVRTINVTRADGSNVRNVNELEYVQGDLLANVWFTNTILRIDAATGRVIETLNLDHLPTLEGHVGAMHGRWKADAVMNGIAYNPANQHVYVTGKLWDSMFELDLNAPRHHIRRHSY